MRKGNRMKIYLHFHRSSYAAMATLTNGSDVNYTFPRWPHEAPANAITVTRGTFRSPASCEPYKLALQIVTVRTV